MPRRGAVHALGAGAKMSKFLACVGIFLVEARYRFFAAFEGKPKGQPPYVFSPTAPSFGVSAQIGSGVVRGGPEVRFHGGSTRVRPGFHQGSTRVPPGFHQGSTRVPPGFHQGSTRVPPGFHQGSTRVPPGFHQGSTRVP